MKKMIFFLTASTMLTLLQSSYGMGERLVLRPSTSIAQKNMLVTVSASIKNEGVTQTGEGVLTVTSGQEFLVLDSNPPATIDGNVVKFRFPKLEEDSEFKGIVKLKVITEIGIVGYPMVVKASSVRGDEVLKTSRVILLWSPTQYPDLVCELRETSRNNGEIKFLLSIKGGYPSYSYFIDWGDGKKEKRSERGALREEGSTEIPHTYEKSGEYMIICTINDLLGKQVVLRRRIFLQTWSFK